LSQIYGFGKYANGDEALLTDKQADFNNSCKIPKLERIFFNDNGVHKGAIVKEVYQNNTYDIQVDGEGMYRAGVSRNQLICTAIQYYTPPPIKEVGFAGYDNLDPPAEDEGLPPCTEDMEKKAKKLSGINKAAYVEKKVKSVVDKRGCSTQINRCQTREHVFNYLNSKHIEKQFPDNVQRQAREDEGAR
jgi:hypothetical protein